MLQVNKILQHFYFILLPHLFYFICADRTAFGKAFFTTQSAASAIGKMSSLVHTTKLNLIFIGSLPMHYRILVYFPQLHSTAQKIVGHRIITVKCTQAPEEKKAQHINHSVTKTYPSASTIWCMANLLTMNTSLATLNVQ